MAIYQTGTVYNGGGAVFRGEAAPSYYNPSPRVNALANISGTQFYGDLDGKYYEQGSTLPQSSSDSAVGVSGNNAAVYYPAAGPSTRHVLYHVDWGYDSTPASGQFYVQSPSGTTIFGPIPITAAGAGYSEWDDGLKGGVGSDMLVVLKKGGPSAIGFVDVSERGYGS